MRDKAPSRPASPSAQAEAGMKGRREASTSSGGANLSSSAKRTLFEVQPFWRAFLHVRCALHRAGELVANCDP